MQNLTQARSDEVSAGGRLGMAYQLRTATIAVMNPIAHRAAVTLSAVPEALRGSSLRLLPRRAPASVGLAPELANGSAALWMAELTRGVEAKTEASSVTPSVTTT